MKLLGARNGLGDMRARCLYLDASGRLWVGFRHDGAFVCDEPEAPTPIFRSIGDRASFASSTVWGITSDRSGRIYFATGRGLDRWAPESGQIEHVSMRDGLPGETVLDVTTDASGRIWIATNGGVSRFDPQLEPAPAAIPPVYLTSVQFAGENLPLPRGGSARVGPFELGPSRNNLRIEYVAPSFRRPVRYQYRLEGADADWQAPTPERTVQYAHLAPGSYRFTVRTLDPEGVPNSNQADLTLRILPPIWQRAWFLALAGGALGAVGLAWHRFRVRRILELESIRQRIASDLHDEIGSGLAQIAVWSEVARREAAPKSAPILEQSATLARSLRDSMSDIVWAIDPRRDRLSDLIERIRQFAFDLLATQGVRVEFSISPQEQLSGVPLAPDTRRHLFLWLKEAPTNVGRHAEASHVTVTIELRARTLVLEVCDNGRGYDLDRTTRGHGLSSLSERASALRGRQEIVSAPGEGTRLRLEAPLPRPRTLV